VKVRPVGVELFHADRQTDRQTDRRTDMTNYSTLPVSWKFAWAEVGKDERKGMGRLWV